MRIKKMFVVTKKKFFFSFLMKLSRFMPLSFVLQRKKKAFFFCGIKRVKIERKQKTIIKLIKIMKQHSFFYFQKKTSSVNNNFSFDFNI